MRIDRPTSIPFRMRYATANIGIKYRNWRLTQLIICHFHIDIKAKNKERHEIRGITKYTKITK